MLTPGKVARALAVLSLAFAPTAHAAAVDAERVADALERRPVYSEPGADPGLSEAQAGALAVRIAQRKPGRIQVAVFAESSVRDSGGLAEVANAVDQALPRSGTLIAATRGNYYVVTTYPQAARASAAVRVAVNRRPRAGRVAQLEAAIDAVAEVDPGAGSDLGGAPPAAPVDAFETFDDVGDTARLVLIITGAAIALPFVGVGIWLLLRARRRRAAEHFVLDDERDALREQLDALAQDVTDLDIDVSMPTADAQGRAAYQSAIELYERGGRLLAGAESRTGIEHARATIAEARMRMDEAKRLLGAAERGSSG